MNLTAQNTSQLEYREIEFEQLEVAEETRENGPAQRSVAGYAAVFNKLSQDLGGFKEKISRGAFAESVKRDIVALWSHNPDLVLARTTNGTLTLEEDESGLKFRMLLDDDQWGDFAFRKIKRGDVKGMSFGFRIAPKGDEWGYNEKKELIRTLSKVQLLEVSPTAFPAYTQTKVSARSLSDVLKSGQEILAAQSPGSLPPNYFRNLRVRLLERL